MSHVAKNAAISMAESSKHMLQVVQLLSERDMAFSFCLNRDECLFVCGLGLLLECFDVKQKGKIMQENRRLIKDAITELRKTNGTAATSLAQLATAVLENALGAHTTTTGTVATVPMHIGPPSSQIQRTVCLETNAGLDRSVYDSAMELDRMSQNVTFDLPIQNTQRLLYSPRRPKPNETKPRIIPRRKHEYDLERALHTRSMLKLQPSSMQKPPSLDYLSLNSPLYSLAHTSSGLERSTEPYAFENSSLLAITNDPTSLPLTNWDVFLASENKLQTEVFDDYNDATKGFGVSTPGLTASLNSPAWSSTSWDIKSLSSGLDRLSSAEDALSFDAMQDLSSMNDPSGFGIYANQL